jgi:hypothetical protein
MDVLASWNAWFSWVPKVMYDCSLMSLRRHDVSGQKAVASVYAKCVPKSVRKHVCIFYSTRVNMGLYGDARRLSSFLCYGRSCHNNIKICEMLLGGFK